MEESGADRFVTLRRGDTTLGIEVAKVRRVLRPAVIQPMSSAAPWVCGKVRVDDRLEVIVDPGHLLGRHGVALGDAPRLVLVSHEARDFGLLADEVEGVIALDESRVQPPPPFLEDRHGVVRGVAVVDDREILLLDLAPLVGAATASRVEGPAD